jgi:uncharacterized protein
MTATFHEASRALQDRFDTRRIADRIDELLVRDEFTNDDADYLATRDMFFLATVDAKGNPQCSYKGGDPGFVRVVDAKTLAFPNYDGNGMYLSMGNVAATSRVGLLFIDFEEPDRMRVNGTATIHMDDPLKAEWPEAQFVVRVTPTQIFPNCPRYIHQYKQVERSEFVPRADCKTPVPGWKRAPWARDHLPASDPARRA